MQCASEEVMVHVVPQLVPNHFESVGVRFAHAPSNASCLFGPEIACKVQKEHGISLGRSERFYA